MIEGRRVFITGGAGFIGSLLAERLLASNEVTIFDNLTRNSLGHRSTMDAAAYRFIKGDVVDVDEVRAAATGHDVIVHCAAIAGVDTVGREPVTTMRVNVIGSFNVLEAALSLTDVHRVVCFSTSEIFGPHAFRSTEADAAVVGPAGEPRWTYAASKVAEEHLALAYHGQFGIPVTVLRPFNVYGPAQTGEGAIRNFARQAIAGKPLVVRGDGTQLRAWTYVDDMVDGVIAALSSDIAVGESFNIANATAVTTTADLARTIIRIARSDSEVVFEDAADAEVHIRLPSTEKATRLLGFTARVPLEDGINRTVQWMRSLLQQEQA